MNNPTRRHRLSTFALSCAGSVLLAGCLSYTERETIAEPLPPCTGSGSMFANLEFALWPQGTSKPPTYSWAGLYHQTVAQVLDEHINTIIGGNDNPVCTASDYRQMIPAGSALRSLAATLPPWKDPTVLAQLSEADLTPVLMEYLRVYECAMREHQFFVQQRIVAERTQLGPGQLWCCPVAGSACITASANNCMLTGGTPLPDAGSCVTAGCGEPRMTYAEIVIEQPRRSRHISEELDVARIALERGLTLAGGLDRLRPLALEALCLERASLDLRNVIGLASDVAACMPRMVDSRGSLRDFDIDEEE